MSGHVFCRDLCLERGEPHSGTGNLAERFILVRWPRGKWRVPRFESVGMGEALAHAIREAMGLGVHVALVDRVGETESLPMLQVDDTVADFDSEAEMAAAIGRAATGGSIVGRPDPRPVLLCCTDSRRDACCARYGFATYKALVAEADPTKINIVQATHVGGCRFAASLVLLPRRQRYARLGPHEAATFLDRIQRGGIYLPAWRGEAGLPEAAQVAQKAGMEWAEAHGMPLASVQLEAMDWPEPTAGASDFVAPLFVGETRLDIHLVSEVFPVNGHCGGLNEGEAPEMTPRWRALDPAVLPQTRLD
ncbi:MAG: hypothetical protein ABS75_10190 [Pelagibacterium sp. SCN 63-23]|nr:MAG: hypothetical protein ABS75_10190 [Pelagibacterium sp. SCN 63-23]